MERHLSNDYGLRLYVSWATLLLASTRRSKERKLIKFAKTTLEKMKFENK
jgi:hypothetical protein